MEEFMKGDVVVIPFPFSNTVENKKRPAFIVAKIGNEAILCQITTSFHIDEFSIPLSTEDFTNGALHMTSIIKPQKLFTAENSAILYKLGSVNKQKK